MEKDGAETPHPANHLTCMEERCGRQRGSGSGSARSPHYRMMIREAGARKRGNGQIDVEREQACICWAF